MSHTGPGASSPPVRRRFVPPTPGPDSPLAVRPGELRGTLEAFKVRGGPGRRWREVFYLVERWRARGRIRRRKRYVRLADLPEVRRSCARYRARIRRWKRWRAESWRRYRALEFQSWRDDLAGDSGGAMKAGRGAARLLLRLCLEGADRDALRAFGIIRRYCP